MLDSGRRHFGAVNFNALPETMPRFHCLPDGKVLDIGIGETILDACNRHGIPHAHACGGRAKCSTCRIWVLDGIENCTSRNDAETRLAETLVFGNEIRLGCQTTVLGDVSFRRLVLDELDLDMTTQLARNRLGPCGEGRDVAVLFADIRDFTVFSRSLSAYDVMYALNRCMYQFGEIIETNGGYIDNVMGDGIMALFGARGEADAALRSVKAATEMLQATDRMKPYMMAMYGQKFDLKIGLHFGEAVIGRIGTANHERMTAIGDTVNIASRIEEANKEMGTRLLVSEELYREVDRFVAVRDYVRTRLRSESERRTLYEVTGLNERGLAACGAPRPDSDLQRFAGRTWTRLVDDAEVPEGGRRIVRRDDFDIQLLRHKGTVFAFNNACPHLMLPFNDSEVTESGELLCRWHESSFDLATGEIRTWCTGLLPDGTAQGHEEIGDVSKNRRPMQTFPVRIFDGGIWLALDGA